MRAFKDYLGSNDKECENEINEGFVAGAVVASKLNAMKNRIAREADIQKQIEELAKMIHFGIGTIALVTNSRRRKC